MINSRDLSELLPPVKEKVSVFIRLCKAASIDLLVTSTYRDFESQNTLYAQGRTAPGKVVTNAKGGQSFHNYRCAIDVVPIVNGKCQWNDKALWDKIGQLGKQAGLEWAGDWVKFKETAHFQYTGGLTLKDLQAGKHIA